MKLFNVLGILFYTSILVLVGVVLIIFALNFLIPDDIHTLLTHIQSTLNLRVIVGASGLLLILISISFAQLILGHFAREKTIAFATGTGQVTIALSAVEDLIRRMSVYVPEIKELRPDVIASKKKGIIVDLRVVLRSEANIPDLTGRLQELVRSKLQDVLGLEEQILVKIHVVKIATMDEKKRKDPLKNEPSIPFQGYGGV